MHDQDVAVPEPAITLSRSVEALKSELERARGEMAEKDAAAAALQTRTRELQGEVQGWMAAAEDARASAAAAAGRGCRVCVCLCVSCVCVNT